VYQTTLAPFKISDQEKFDGIMFCPSAVELLTNNKIKNEICFCRCYHCKSIRVKENKNM
jgi:uroporphyrinogen-III synthase